MLDTNDPRTRERIAVDADVSLVTLKRFLASGEKACRPCSVRRIRDAMDALEAKRGPRPCTTSRPPCGAAPRQKGQAK